MHDWSVEPGVWRGRRILHVSQESQSQLAITQETHSGRATGARLRYLADKARRRFDLRDHEMVRVKRLHRDTQTDQKEIDEKRRRSRQPRHLVRTRVSEMFE